MKQTHATFRFESKKVHLTYKGYQDWDDIIVTLGTHAFDTPQYFSLVHEEGDDDEEHATPYQHTHVAIMWAQPQRKRGADIFDIISQDDKKHGTHPHIQCNKGLKWMEHVMTRYHLGHKTKADGKKYFKPPIFLQQQLPQCWNNDIWDEIVAAKSLKDAALIIDAKPKSLSDIKLIRSEVHKRKFAEIESDCEKEWIEPPSDWNPKKQALVIEGTTQLGKTNWAKAHFGSRGFEITELEDLKSVPEGTTGLIFDDQEYAQHKIQTQKMVADVRKGCSIRCRHSNPWKPHLPAIFTTNNIDTLFRMDDEAIASRVYLWRVNEKMFKD